MTGSKLTRDMRTSISAYETVKRLHIDFTEVMDLLRAHGIE